MATLSLDELLLKLPEALRPLAAQYAPVLLKMTSDELWAWITLVLQGKTDEALKNIVSRMPNADLFVEWNKTNEDWLKANANDRAKRALMQTAAMAVLKVLLDIALALVFV
jgi:hypothetical protein